MGTIVVYSFGIPLEKVEKCKHLVKIFAYVKKKLYLSGRKGEITMRWIFTIVLVLLSIGVWAEDDCVIIKDGKAIPLYGKVKIVEHFPDLKVQIVEHFPDLEIVIVQHAPDDCGEVQLVESFPDVKVQIVEHFPDIKVRIVRAFPGMTTEFTRKQKDKR